MAEIYTAHRDSHSQLFCLISETLSDISTLGTTEVWIQHTDCICHELGLFSLSLSLFFSLSRPGPAWLFFPTCSSLQSALALLLCHTCSHFCHYFLSTSSVCFPLLFVGLFHVYVSHACVSCYLHEHLPCLVCLIKSRRVVLVCVLSCLSHPAACDLVQGLCFCPTRSSSSAIYPQDRGDFI